MKGRTVGEAHTYSIPHWQRFKSYHCIARPATIGGQLHGGLSAVCPVATDEHSPQNSFYIPYAKEHGMAFAVS